MVRYKSDRRDKTCIEFWWRNRRNYVDFGHLEDRVCTVRRITLRSM